MSLGRFPTPSKLSDLNFPAWDRNHTGGSTVLGGSATDSGFEPGSVAWGKLLNLSGPSTSSSVTWG